MKKTIALILALIFVMAAPISSFAYSKPVENIEITIDPKIAGMTPADCAEFLTVSGEGITFDSSTFKATYIADQFWNTAEAEVFEEGKTYTSFLYVYPADGYLLSYYPEFVNISYKILRSSGEVDGSFVCNPEDHYDDELAGYYKIMISYTVEAQKPTGIARIPFLISNFFEAIATFFTETFIQPIADLIMKIS